MQLKFQSLVVNVAQEKKLQRFLSSRIRSASFDYTRRLSRLVRVKIIPFVVESISILLYITYEKKVE
jgi:hypothetical protein